MKEQNERCPLQAECERKCKFKGKELECGYYHANARPGYEIADQEEKRFSPSKLTFDRDDFDDLDDDVDEVEEVETEGRINGLMCKIPVDKLIPHPDNPRKDLGDLTELAASIEAKGVLQNLTVVPEGDDTYRIIIGHRRHAAAKLAGLAKLPCVIVDMTPQEQFETMMVENVQRSDLTVYEQAEGFQMMLDMGGTVEKVSQKTGFSETTVRNRVKLLQLNKKKFHQAEQRGGTLQDYLKLNKITDPSLRDKVLDTVGTAEFNVTLKNAQKTEQDRDYKDRILSEFKAADWCREAEEGESLSGYDYVVTYETTIKREFKRPDDADTEEYVYRSSAHGVTLYKKKATAEAAAADILEEKHKELLAELLHIGNELDRISNIHLECREEFIMNFTAFNSSEMDIAAFATKAMLYDGEPNVDRLGNLLGVSVSADEELDPQEWNRELFRRPERCLLITAYAKLEEEGQKYNVTPYDYKVSAPIPKRKERNLGLDLIYNGLITLGYEMSEEETQMKEGTHPLFRKAINLVDAYLREKEAAEK